MPLFRISNPWSGFVGIYKAENSDSALDAMAREMGFDDYEHAYRKGRIDCFELNIERLDGEEEDNAQTYGPQTCEDILARLSEDDLRDLESWRRSEDRDSTHLGGRGRTLRQQAEAARAWDALSPDARRAYHDVLCCVERELEEAIQAVGAPEDTGRDIEAVEWLLGPDHPALRILPAHVLVGAYRDIVE